MAVEMSREKEILDRAGDYIRDQVEKGYAPKEIIDAMVSQGYTQQEASTAVGSVLATAAAPVRPVRAAPRGGGGRGMQQMVIGGLICVAGIAVTVGTRAMAANNGGGSYVVAWGAIIFGAIRFFRGLAANMRGE